MPPPFQQENDSVLSVHALLDEACMRNAVIELHRRENQNSHPAARGRMLAIRDETVLVADPQIIGREAMLFTGQDLDGYFAASGAMFQFATRVVETDTPMRLNNQKIVLGVRLSLPKSLRRGQRRSAYRTSLVCDTPIAAILRRVSSIDPIQCPIDERPIHGAIVDASPGGFGINLPNILPTQFKLYETYFLSFMIPEAAQRMHFLVELRQARELPEIGASRVGVLMLPWPTQRDHTREIQPLLKRLNEIERRLRRTS